MVEFKSSRQSNRDKLQRIKTESEAILEQISFFSSPKKHRTEIVRKYFSEIGKGEDVEALILSNLADCARFNLDVVDSILNPGENQ